jgi:hypothetical protein
MPGKKKGGPPDDESFHKVLDFLNPDRNRAWEDYDRMHKKLVRYFEGHGCWCAEELADRTFDRLSKIEDERLRSIPPSERTRFTFGVAKNILHEWRDEVKGQQLPPAPIEQLAHAESEVPQQQIYDVCKEKLPDGDQSLFNRYYQSISAEDSRKLKDIRTALAKQANISKAALASKILKIKRKIESCCHCCMKCLDK